MCEEVYDTENDILESIFRNLEYYPSVDVIVILYRENIFNNRRLIQFEHYE